MASEVFTVYTFGDSILDCARYNEYGVHPGQLIVRNDDGLFPDFKGRDLSSSAPARLDHRARDRATVDDLPRQGRVLDLSGPAAALVTIRRKRPSHRFGRGPGRRYGALRARA